MANYFSEWIVARETPSKVKAVRALLIVVSILGVALIVLVPYVGFLLEAGIVFLAYLYIANNSYVEWEYSFADKTLFVDKIMGRAKRKKMGEFELSNMEVAAFNDSYHIKEYDKKELKTFDFTSLNPDKKKFAIILPHNNETVKVLIEPDDRMLKELKDIAPRQVHND